MILADVGNRHIHIFVEENREILHLNIDDALEQFGNQKLYFISVNEKSTKKILSQTSWKSINNRVKIAGEYEGMGVDRKALCLSRGDGVYIDAGSAVTVDRVRFGRYEGGFIFQGLYSYQRSYQQISPKLSFEVDELGDCSLESLPKGTKEQLICSVIYPIKSILNTVRGELPLYITGGDGEIFKRVFDDATFDSRLIFEGMKRVLKN